MNRLSYVHAPRSEPYRYVTIPEILKSNKDKYKDSVVAIHREPEHLRKVLHYDELEQNATLLAKYLVQNGIKKGDHIGIFGPNTLAWIIGEMAIFLSGAVSVHLTINTTDIEKTLKLMSAGNIKALILDPGERNEMENVVTTLMERFNVSDVGIPKDSAIEFAVLLREMTGYPNFPTLPGMKNMFQITATLPQIFPEDTAFICQTSGSTGDPKFIKLSHFALLNGFTDPFIGRLIFNDRPFSWLGGYPFTEICLGNALVFSNPSRSLKGKSTEFILKVLKEEKVHAAVLLPYFLKDLMNYFEGYTEDDWRLTNVYTGGQIIDINLTKIIGKFCDEIVIAYGSSEALAVNAPQNISDASYETGKVGYPNPGVEVKIVDDEGRTIEIGRIGKLLCRSRCIFQGYYNRDDLTSEVLSPDGWLDTGDVGLINTKGEITIKGRVNHIISRGTRKIVPSDIENIVMEMPNLNKVSVIGVPDARLYEEVCVCYTTLSVAVSPHAVEDFCKTKFVVSESYDGLGDMPKYFLHFNELPLLSNGKPDKSGLRQQAMSRLNLKL